MATRIAHGVNLPFIPTLGEPTSWAGPYTGVSFVGAPSALIHVFGGANSSLIGSNGMPHAVQSKDHNAETYYLDVPNITDAQPWRNFSGDIKGTATGTEFILIPNSTSSHDTWKGVAMEDGKFLIVWGPNAGATSKLLEWDVDNNSVKIDKDSDSTAINYDEHTFGDIERFAMCQAGDGNIYAFGGIKNSNNAWYLNINQYNPAGETWTLMSGDTLALGKVCMFATMLADGRIWFGGGSRQASCSIGQNQYETFYWDPTQSAGNRLSNGPTLPSVGYVAAGTLDYRNAGVVTLGDGEVLIACSEGGSSNTYIFNPVSETFRQALVELPFRYLGESNFSHSIMRLPDQRILLLSNGNTYISEHATP